ncbi:MAG: 6-phosphogluconolactonase [Acaryochloridaceae cyanobacterium SU_2_1]|nr:6-phosphogluconolactonase [Acaryochloridaceae cyanobacterium SU_2_1]
MIPQVEIFPDLTSLIDCALVLTLAAINRAISTDDRCTLVLAGGNTPKPLYEKLADLTLPWEKIHIFWGDERYVPISHTDSNAGMAMAAWLNHVPIPAENIHPMPTAGSPQADAQAYDQHLQDFFGLGPADFPCFDLVFLGLGPDGHTASLFPHTAALEIKDRNVTLGQKDQEPRITLTVPVLNQAQSILFLVTGSNKQEALSQIFAPVGDSALFPARLIQPTKGELVWLLDEAAGQNFHPSSALG